MKQITTFTIISLSLPRNISVPPWVPWEIKSQGNVMNCPETNKKIVDPPHSGGGVPRGIGQPKFMVACMFQVKRFYCEADYNFYNHLALTPQEYQRTPVGPMGNKKSGKCHELSRNQ